MALVKGAGIEPITEGNYTVTINEPENGTVVTTHLKADAGAEVTLVVTPATNYTLVKLRIEKVTSDPNGDSPALARRRSNIVVAGDIAYATTDNKNFTFTMPASDVEVTAVFTNKPVAEPTFAYDATNNKVTLTPGAADDTFAANAKVYYTTDGSDPTTSDTRQEATAATDITVTADMTVVKAVGADADGNLSQVVEQAVSYQRMITVSKEWTAFCSPETFAVPTGLKAYTIESVTQPDGTEEGTVTLKEQTVIARNVPMIIQNTVVTDGITSFPIANADAVEIAAEDQCAEFKGVAEATTLTADHVYYVLKDGVFIRAKAGTVNAYNCYLQFDAAASARCFTLAISYSGTTAIEAVATIPAASVTGTVTFYRLDGTQVTAPTQKGIYICQGKRLL